MVELHLESVGGVLEGLLHLPATKLTERAFVTRRRAVRVHCRQLAKARRLRNRSGWESASSVARFCGACVSSASRQVATGLGLPMMSALWARRIWRASSFERFVISAPLSSFQLAGRREPWCLMSRWEAVTTSP